MPSRFRNIPCATGPWTRAPTDRAVAPSAAKSTWAVRSAHPGEFEGIRETVRTHGLKGVAGRASLVAVVDDQRRPLCDDPARHRGGVVRASPFDDLALAGRRRNRRWGLHGVRHDRPGEFAGIPDRHRSFIPAVASAFGLTHRQGVEELVGEDNAWPRRNLVERIVPARGHVASERLPLAFAQSRAGLDEMNVRRLAECRQCPSRAHRIRHHGAATGAEFDQPHRVRRAHRLPGGRGPQADQFAKHLADLRRGDEIAVRPQRGAVRVVPVLGVAKAKCHEIGHRHRPRVRDAAADFVLERGAVGCHHGCTGRRRSAKAITPRPAMNNGTHSSMPIVIPPHRNPSCASGSRKNSQNERNSA